MKFLIAAVLTLILTTSYCQTKELSSPNGRIRIAVTIDKGITYSFSFDNKLILASSSIDLILKNGKALSEHASLKKAATNQVRETILPPVAEKRKVIPDNYNELSLTFKQKFTISFRAYDDGIAYRFATSIKDTLFVYNEVSEYNFPENHEVYYPEVARRDNCDEFHTSFEEPYKLKPLDSIGENNLVFSPILITPKEGPKLLITEFDIEDYPGMFMTGTGSKKS